MARKRKGATPISKLTRRVASRKKKRRKPRPRKVSTTPAPAPNPVASMFGGVANMVIPGIAAYAGTRIAGRIAYKIGKKRSASFARHVGALTPPIVAVGTMVAAAKMDRLEAYREGLVIGSTIAGVQALVQAYLPKYGWILNDYHLDDVLPLATQPNGAIPTGPQPTAPPLEEPPGSARPGPRDEIDELVDQANGRTRLPTATASPVSRPALADDDILSASWLSSY